MTNFNPIGGGHNHYYHPHDNFKNSSARAELVQLQNDLGDPTVTKDEFDKRVQQLKADLSHMAAGSNDVMTELTNLQTAKDFVFTQVPIRDKMNEYIHLTKGLDSDPTTLPGAAKAVLDAQAARDKYTPGTPEWDKADAQVTIADNNEYALMKRSGDLAVEFEEMGIENYSIEARDGLNSQINDANNNCAASIANLFQMIPS
ncbi:MAG: hypothetical protein ACOYK9_05085 [Chlamydiia bacterium]